MAAKRQTPFLHNHVEVQWDLTLNQLKRARVGRNNQSQPDRLSSLPEDVLHLVVSFIETSEVVRTSVLSKRWRNFWTSIPFLVFNFVSYAKSFGRETRNVDEIGDEFWHYTTRVLLLRGRSPIRSIRLFNDEVVNSQQIKQFFFAIGGRHVDEVELYIKCSEHIQVSYSGPDGTIKFPVELCESLTVMEFKADKFCPSLEAATAFQKLRMLRLNHIWFTSNDFVRKLFSESSYTLEELYLENCRFPKCIKVIDISAPNLKYFTFQNESTYSKFFGELKVCTPKLLSFDYYGPMLSRYTLLNLSSLEEANTSLSNIFGKYYPPSLPKSYTSVMPELINALYNAETLTLSSDVIECFSRELLGIDTLQNLRYLKLELDCVAKQVDGLFSLLKLSPNLEFLHAHFRELSRLRGGAHKYPSTWKSKESVVCVSGHLKVFKISGAFRSRIPADFISYLIQNGKVLEDLEVGAEHWDE